VPTFVKFGLLAYHVFAALLENQDSSSSVEVKATPCRKVKRMSIDEGYRKCFAKKIKMKKKHTQNVW